jgi:hypothetical protein
MSHLEHYRMENVIDTCYVSLLPTVLYFPVNLPPVILLLAKSGLLLQSYEHIKMFSSELYESLLGDSLSVIAHMNIVWSDDI